MNASVQPHNEKPASVWNSGGELRMVRLGECLALMET